MLSAAAGPRFEGSDGTSQIREFSCAVVAAVGVGRLGLGGIASIISRMIWFYQASEAKQRMDQS